MKKELKDSLNTYVKSIVANNGVTDTVKAVTLLKEVDDSEIENRIKKQRLKLDKEKFEFEKEKINLEEKKIKIEENKIDFEKKKFEISSRIDQDKINLEKERLDFEKVRFKSEKDTKKKERIVNVISKCVEIALPLLVNGALFVLLLKATYADDVRIPSDTARFIGNVLKR